MSQDYLAALLAVSRNKRYAKARLELLDAIGTDAVREVISDCLSNGLPDNVLQQVAALMLDARATSPSDETVISQDQNNKARNNSEQRKTHTPSDLAHAETATPSEHPMSQDSFTARSSQQRGAEKETHDGRSNKALHKRMWSFESSDELGIDRVLLDIPQGSTQWSLDWVAIDGTTPRPVGKPQNHEAENGRAGMEAATTTPESSALVPPSYQHGQRTAHKGRSRKWCGYCQKDLYSSSFRAHMRDIHALTGSE
jgi:hypothetical protein